MNDDAQIPHHLQLRSQAKMSSRELCEYFHSYQHLHDYIWYRLKGLGFHTNAEIAYAKELEQLKEFHDNISNEHTVFLSNHICSDTIFTTFNERLQFFMGLSLSRRPGSALAHIFLVFKIAEKLMDEGSIECVNRLIKEASAKLCF